HPLPGAHIRARALRRNMTEAERQLWRILRSRQIGNYRFRRQVPLGRYIADFVCHKARLIIEVDGGQHALAAGDGAECTAFLENEGYRVLRFWNNEVLANLDGVYDAVVGELAVTPTQTLPHRGGGVSRRLGP